MNHHRIPRSFGTHDGTFHADEVTACALLLLFDMIDFDSIVRTRDLQMLSTCDFVCDVGGEYDPGRRLFDHHQAEYRGKMSSAGMILLYLKDTGVIDQKEYRFFNNTLIMGVDAHDNGIDPQIPGFCSYSHVISSFVPVEQDVIPVTQNTAFFEALRFSKDYLSRLWQRYKYIQSCRAVVAESMANNKDCLIFERGIPWLDIFFELEGAHHPALFVIMPSGNQWKLRGIPPDFERKMEVRMPLPQEWAGLLDEDLKQVSGIPGAVFCHKGRFISVWESREDAIKAYEYTVRLLRR